MTETRDLRPGADTAADPIARGQYLQLLGEELRDLRKSRGCSREDLGQRLEIPASPQTIATYELGTRQCGVVRLVELCRALDGHAHELMLRAYERTVVDAHSGPFRLDLADVLAANQLASTPLGKWARSVVGEEFHGRSCQVGLSRPALDLLAELCGISRSDLLRMLRALRE